MYGGNHQFDGSAAFEGGGFVPTQTPHTNDHSSSSSSASKNRDLHALLPLTARQLINALETSRDGSNLQVDGVDVNNVTLVGMMVGGKSTVTVFHFLLDDGTGRIDCSRWLNEEGDSDEIDHLRDGMYVRVIGHLKVFNGKMQVNLYSIRPITEFDEITYHFVDCIYVHNYNTGVRGTDPPLNKPNSAGNTPSKAYQAPPSNLYTGGVQYTGVGLTQLQEMIRNYMLQHENIVPEKGVDVRDMAKAINVPLEKIQHEINMCVEEGTMYSTVDEWSFKTTTNG